MAMSLSLWVSSHQGKYKCLKVECAYVLTKTVMPAL